MTTCSSGEGEVVEERRSETGGQIIARAHEVAKALLGDLAACSFDPSRIEELVMRHCNGPAPRVEHVLGYVVETLVPSVLRTSDEIDAVLKALSGGFVPPGPSGSPTRGQADILPTGRNFYSLDPRIIPTPGAWEVGKSLGDSLLERCLQEQGHYPESVGIIVWGGTDYALQGG